MRRRERSSRWIGSFPRSRRMAENAKSTIKMLRPGQVWQPRIGAPPGNRNALKHGRYTHRTRAALAFLRKTRRRAIGIALTVQRRIKGLPIAAHQLDRPVRFAYVAARQKPFHHRLYVEHRRAVDGVEAAHA